LKNRVIFILIFLQAVSSLAFSQPPLWRQKLQVTDLKNRDAGWVEVIVSSTDTGYRTEVYSDTYLPFWFFTGISKTKEIEYYDRKNLPVESHLEIVSKPDRIFTIATKRTGDTLNLFWEFRKEGNKPVKTKVRSLKLKEDTVTPGNLWLQLTSRDLFNKNRYEFYLLDKFKLEYKKVIISTGEKKILNGKEIYKLHIDIGLFGNFNLYITRDYYVTDGKGMGIKVFPIK